jgi:MoxR-like ATPase
LQQILRGVPVSDDVVDYAVRLGAASRTLAGGTVPESVTRYVTYGASPRASQYLILGAKARALLAHRYHVNFEDVRSVTLPVLRHRLVLNFRSRADRVEPDAVVEEILRSVPEEV